MLYFSVLISASNSAGMYTNAASVEGDEGFFQPKGIAFMKCQNNYDSSWRTITKFLWKLGRNKPSYSYTKDSHGMLLSTTGKKFYSIDRSQENFSTYEVEGRDKKYEMNSSEARTADLEMAVLVQVWKSSRLFSFFSQSNNAFNSIHFNYIKWKNENIVLGIQIRGCRMLWRPPIHCAIVASNPLCYHGLQSTELWQPPIRSAILASKTMNYDGLQSTMLWQPPINCTMMTSTPKCYHGLQSTELWQPPIHWAMTASNQLCNDDLQSLKLFYRSWWRWGRRGQTFEVRCTWWSRRRSLWSCWSILKNLKKWR